MQSLQCLSDETTAMIPSFGSARKPLFYLFNHWRSVNIDASGVGKWYRQVARSVYYIMRTQAAQQMQFYPHIYVSCFPRNSFNIDMLQYTPPSCIHDIIVKPNSLLCPWSYKNPAVSTSSWDKYRLVSCLMVNAIAIDFDAVSGLSLQIAGLSHKMFWVQHFKPLWSAFNAA